MTLTIASDLIPLAADESGVIRVKGTRVTLDTIVETFNEGYGGRAGTSGK